MSVTVRPYTEKDLPAMTQIWNAVVEDGRIIGGLGVIENDFHDRKDLSPNVCAVYVEEDRRCRGHRRRNAALRLRGHEGQGRAGTVSGDRPYVFL